MGLGPGPHGRKPREVHRKEQDQQKPQPIGRDRGAKGGKGDGDAVERAAGTARGDDGQRQGKGEPGKEPCKGEGEAVGHGRAQIGPDRPASDSGVAQIEVQQRLHPACEG